MQLKSLLMRRDGGISAILASCLLLAQVNPENFGINVTPV